MNPIPYKTHLFNPGSNLLTLCGRKLRLHGTHDPVGVTCKNCLRSYLGNVAWYWKLAGKPIPRLGIMVAEDEPFPELVVIWRRDGQGRFIGREVIFIEEEYLW